MRTKSFICENTNFNNKLSVKIKNFHPITLCNFTGNPIEQKIYRNLTLTDFIQRLLTRRCASFLGKNDKYLLLTNERGCGGFQEVGTKYEKSPLLLKNVLSYDEIKLSAFLSPSSHTEFLNSGNRLNGGVIEKHKIFIEREGVIVGLTGARLTKSEVMDFQDIIINKTQNTRENGYGVNQEDEHFNKTKDYRRIWKKFYEEPDFLYDHIRIDGQRFVEATNKDDIFDTLLMKKRYAISIDTLLLESEARAKAVGQPAYIHIVDVGLRAWRAAKQQTLIFNATFLQRVKYLLPKLPHIGVLHFAGFNLNEEEGEEIKNNSFIKSATHPQGGIKCFVEKRNPAASLYSPYNKMLLIVAYAWDGNALPGNEFWLKTLKSTEDFSTSTACSTLIAEIHNPHINSRWLNGDNLHIASEKYGIIHVADYARNVAE